MLPQKLILVWLPSGSQNSFKNTLHQRTQREAFLCLSLLTWRANWSGRSDFVNGGSNPSHRPPVSPVCVPPSLISGSRQPLTNPSIVQKFVQCHHLCPFQYSIGQLQRQTGTFLASPMEKAASLNFFRKPISCLP